MRGVHRSSLNFWTILSVNTTLRILILLSVNALCTQNIKFSVQKYVIWNTPHVFFILILCGKYNINTVRSNTCSAFIFMCICAMYECITPLFLQHIQIVQHSLVIEPLQLDTPKCLLVWTLHVKEHIDMNKWFMTKHPEKRQKRKQEKTLQDAMSHVYAYKNNPSLT